MENKTAMMKLYDMLDEGKISDIAEIKEYFLMLEQRQIENTWNERVKEGNITFTIDNRTSKEYFEETYK